MRESDSKEAQKKAPLDFDIIFFTVNNFLNSENVGMYPMVDSMDDWLFGTSSLVRILVQNNPLNKKALFIDTSMTDDYVDYDATIRYKFSK